MSFFVCFASLSLSRAMQETCTHFLTKYNCPKPVPNLEYYTCTKSLPALEIHVGGDQFFLEVIRTAKLKNSEESARAYGRSYPVDTQNP